MITAQIASLPNREDGLSIAVHSLLPQVDRIFVALNGYDKVPEFLYHHKITYAMLDNSLGDAAKFYDIEKRKGYILTCDDDLSYPNGYALYMVSRVDKYKGIVSLLGKRYDNRPVKSFRTGYSSIYRCLTNVKKDYKVDIVGTGAMAFHADRIKLSVADFIHPNMADIWLSKAAHEQNVPLVSLAHRARYVGHILYPWRIWSCEDNDKYHTEVLNSFLK